MKVDGTKKLIAVFLSFSFGLPLVCVLLTKNFVMFNSGCFHFILYGVEAMTPSIAAIITTMIFTRSSGIKSLFKKCYCENIKVGYWGLALILPITVLFITKLSVLLFIDVSFIKIITPMQIVIILWALIAEELGWRGFLQNELNKYFGYITTPIILGIIWSLWHYHFLLAGVFSAPMILFMIGCIADSFAYFWITKKSDGNIIPASIWHFTGNLFFNLFMINPEYNQGSIIPYLLFVIYSSIMAVGMSIWGVLTTKQKNRISYRRRQ